MGEEEKKVVEKKSFGQIVSDSMKELGETMVAFVKSPRALWGINIPYVVEGLVYFGVLTILGKFCSENVALSDLHAGWVYGGLTGGITFAMLLFGGVSDKIGVRLSLFVSLLLMAVGRGLVALSDTIDMGQGMGSPMFFTMVIGLFLVVIAYGLYQPAAYAGVKRYTNPKTAAVGYGVIYALMNLGAFLSGILSPGIRHTFEKVMPPNGLGAVFWFYSGLTLIAALSTVFIITKAVDKRAVERVKNETKAIRENEDKKEEEKKEEPKEKIKINNTGFIVILILALAGLFMLLGTKVGKLSVPAWASWGMIIVFGIWAIWEFLRKRPEHPFRDTKFVFFICVLIPVQTLFAHNWLTIPYYLDRAFAGTPVSEYFEFFSNLNPIIIFVITPIIAAMTSRANVYRMMIIGTLVMAAPTFLLVIGPNMYLFILYIILMSVGEAMWQPRFLQWISEIAPEGKTGAYMGIGQLPWFLTKMLTAMYSGYFVATYIPKPGEGEPNTSLLWLIYGCIAMVSPVALWLAKSWMYKGMTSKPRN